MYYRRAMELEFRNLELEQDLKNTLKYNTGVAN